MPKFLSNLSEVTHKQKLGVPSEEEKEEFNSVGSNT